MLERSVICIIRLRNISDKATLVMVAVKVTTAVSILLLSCNWGLVCVSGDSMYPTCCDKDIILIDKTLSKIDYGVFTVKSAELGKTIIKRIIGLPGDELSFVNGNLFRNGVEINEHYVELQDYCSSEYNVPVGTVFVAGDNRLSSMDSRFMENAYIPIECVVGRYVFNFSKFIREVFT